MNWFEKISKWYTDGLWAAISVQNAVLKGKLTQAQADEITGGQGGV